MCKRKELLWLPTLWKFPIESYAVCWHYTGGKYAIELRQFLYAMMAMHPYFYLLQSRHVSNTWHRGKLWTIFHWQRLKRLWRLSQQNGKKIPPWSHGCRGTVATQLSNSFLWKDEKIPTTLLFYNCCGFMQFNHFYQPQVIINSNSSTCSNTCSNKWTLHQVLYQIN